MPTASEFVAAGGWTWRVPLGTVRTPQPTGAPSPTVGQIYPR